MANIDALIEQVEKLRETFEESNRNSVKSFIRFAEKMVDQTANGGDPNFDKYTLNDSDWCHAIASLVADWHSLPCKSIYEITK